MKIIICLLLITPSIFGFVNLKTPKIKSSDFKRLTNGQWKGKLTYQDYRSVVERINFPNKTMRIVTTNNETDNDKPAVFRHTYLLSKKSFSIKKEVKYKGTQEFFERNEYSWIR